MTKVVPQSQESSRQWRRVRSARERNQIPLARGLGDDLLKSGQRFAQLVLDVPYSFAADLVREATQQLAQHPSHLIENAGCPSGAEGVSAFGKDQQ